MPAAICCSPPALHPEATWYPPDQNSPHATPCPTQPASNPYPPSASAWRGGEGFLLGARGLLLQASVLCCCDFPLLSSIHSKNSPLLSSSPQPPPPTGQEHLLKDNVIPGPGPEAGIPRLGFLGEGGLKDWNLGGGSRGEGGQALGAHSIPLRERDALRGRCQRDRDRVQGERTKWGVGVYVEETEKEGADCTSGTPASISVGVTHHSWGEAAAHALVRHRDGQSGVSSHRMHIIGKGSLPLNPHSCPLEPPEGPSQSCSLSPHSHSATEFYSHPCG